MEKKSNGDDEDEHGNVVETGILLLWMLHIIYLTEAIGVGDFLLDTHSQ